MLSCLYVGSNRVGSTNAGRVDGLREAGFDTFHLVSDPWVKARPTWWRALHKRSGVGPLLWAFNHRIREEVAKKQPDVLWIDKGTWVTPGTIRFAQTRGVFVVHYTPDPAIRFHATRNFLKSIPLYDLLFTTKRWEIEDYRERGARRVEYSPKGTDERSRRPMTLSPEEQRRHACDVVFLGHAETHYVATIRGILARYPEINLHIWGKWQDAVKQYPELSPYWKGPGVFGDDYAKALSGAKIALGFLSKYIPETETARTFEIPACGTLLLAERTDSHQQLFEEGKEAEFYATVEEAVEKIKMLLNDPARLEKTAAAGYQRFKNSNYSVRSAMRGCAETVAESITDKTATRATR